MVTPAVFTADECHQRFNCTSASLCEYTAAVEQEYYDSQTLLYATSWLPNRCIASTTACGQLWVHTLQSLLEHHAQPGTTQRPAPPMYRISAHDGPAYACASTTISSIPMILTGGDDGNVHCWRCDSLGGGATPSTTLTAMTVAGPCATAAECNSIAFDATTGHVVGGFGGGMIHTWDVQHGTTTPLRSIAGHKQSVACIASRGGALATAALDGTVREWDLRQGSSTPVITIQSPPLRRGGRAQMRCVMFDPEGTTLVCGSTYPDLLLFSRVAGKPLSAVQVDATPQALGSGTGEILVAGASSRMTSYNYLGMKRSDVSCCCCDDVLDTGKVVGRIQCSGSAMYGLAVCPESGMVLACGAGGVLDVLYDGSVVGSRSCA